jgi:hypothetical protein
MDLFHFLAGTFGFTIVADAGLLWVLIRSGHLSTLWPMMRGAV